MPGYYEGSYEGNGDDYSDSQNCDKVAPNGAPSRPRPMPSSMHYETRQALPKALDIVFQAHKVCSFEHVCRCLKEIFIIEAMRPKEVLRPDLILAAGGVYFREELLEIINQVAINIHGVFVSKSSTDYPQYDGLRNIVIDLLKAEHNAKLEKAAVIESAKLQLNREITNTEFQKVISELCTLQGSAWVLKSGDRVSNSNLQATNYI